jgi:parvulin-like peptidyl-prolyl isomerase
MKYSYRTAALLCAALSLPVSAQVASHTPTSVTNEVAATASKAKPFVPGSSMQVTGRPVARVNGAVLTDRDLLREMFAIFPYAREHGGNFPKSEEAEIRKGALKMIEYEELVYQDAERRKVTIPARQLKQAEEQYRQTFPSDAAFKLYLNTELGGSMARYRHQVRRSLLIEKMLKIELDDRSKVTLAEARRFYNANPKLFHHGESFAFQTISVMPPDNASPEVKQKAHQRAEDLLRQAKATKSYEEFGLLAEKSSDDDYRVNMGDHHMVDGGTLPAEMVKAARAMKPGQVSGLLQFGNYYTFFRLNAHVPAGQVKFEEIKAKLLSDLHKTKYDRLRADFDKRLRAHAKIEEL